MTTLNVQVVNCTVSKFSTSPNVDSSAAKTTVILKKTIVRKVSKGLRVKSKELSLSIESSKIDNSGRYYPEQDCPQFIVTDKFESLVAHFSKSSFKYAFLIDLAASHQKKSNVSIIDSIFDDDIKIFEHNGCFSGITLRNTTALIVNSNFTNIISKKSLIKAIASFVTFKECIFINISSKLGMFSLSSSIIASFNQTNAINNKLNGFNYGSVYLQSCKGIFQNCTFHNNTVNGQYGNGGAMCVLSSNITVQQCFFKENTATYIGGTIGTVKSRGIFVNCTFEKNSVYSILQRYYFGGAVCGLYNSYLTMHQCIFKENNTVNGQYGNGGAMCVLSSNITVQQCFFKENTATYIGGTIGTVKSRGIFVNCTFEKNSVYSILQRYYFGGAVCGLYNSYLTMHQCIFKENTATYSGGAIHIQRARGSFVNCTLEVNSVKSRLQKKWLRWSNICTK